MAGHAVWWWAAGNLSQLVEYRACFWVDNECVCLCLNLYIVLFLLIQDQASGLCYHHTPPFLYPPKHSVAGDRVTPRGPCMAHQLVTQGPHTSQLLPQSEG